MNAQTNNMAASDALEQITMAEVYDAVEALWSDICDLQRKSYLLMGDLETSLDPTRGKKCKHGITLMFQERGIDVTQWLGSEVWSNAVLIEKKANDLIRRLEGAIA